MFGVRNLTVRRGDRTVIDGVTLSAAAGDLLGIVGPNGAGKTTLMRAALGLVPSDGHAPLAAMPPVERARQAAWLPQARDVAWPVTVESVVELGRTPWRGYRPGLSEADRAVVGRALSRLGLEGYRTRIASKLSGGEQSLVLIARALAQETPLLMADEPITGLDPAHQLSTMRVFSDLAREGRTVVVSIHDLGLAARFCTRIAVLQAGRLVAEGPPGDVLSEELLARVFRIRAHFERTANGLVFQPLDPIEAEA